MKKIVLALTLLLGIFSIPLISYATVTNTINKVSYSGDDISSVFSFSFNVYKNTDLTIYTITSGVTTQLTLNTDYTVSLTKAPPTTGSITLLSGVLPTGTTLLIERILPLTQQISISDYSPTPATTWNEGLDRPVMLIQQLQEQLNRAVLQSVTATSPLLLPEPTTGYCLGWLADGTLTNLACGSSGGGGGGGTDYNPPIDDSQLQPIVSASKVKGSALYQLNTIPAGAGAIPSANIVSLPDSSLAQITTASKVSATALTGLSSTPAGAGLLPLANLNTITVAKGGTGATTAQGAMDALTSPSSGTNGQVWTTNGTHGSWQNGSAPIYYASSTNEIGSATTERYGEEAVYTKVKEITLIGSGELTISFDLATDNGGSGDSSAGRIYRNGVAIGTERHTNTTSFVTYTEEISGWSNGDKIQIYCKTNDIRYKIKNFIIYGTTLQVNTD